MRLLGKCVAKFTIIPPTPSGNKESGHTSSRLRTMVYDSSRCVFVRTKRADWKSTKEYFLFMPLHPNFCQKHAEGGRREDNKQQNTVK